MSVDARELAIDTFVPMLRSLSKVLDAGAAHAKAKGFDPAVLVNARLAPDMFTLQQQVQLACHFAKDALVRLVGQEATPPAFVEESYDDLKRQIEGTIYALESHTAATLKGAAERDIVMVMPGGVVFEMKGYQLLRDWSFPHFYFHVVTAYDILRHNGVVIGKRDYVGGVARHLRQPAAPAPV
jgi:hypothetical protein